MGKAIGIDLGTTNSVASIVLDGKVQVLRSATNEYFTPSVVSYRASRSPGKPGEMLVGRAALGLAVMAPEDTIFSIKRLIGRTIDDPKVAESRARFPYRVEPAEDGSAGIQVKAGPHSFTPTEISTMILRSLVEDAQRSLGDVITSAVITVPAYFSEAQRAATVAAGTRAGLEVLKIIDEPTAAAIAFGMDRLAERHRILVFDLGGGTFDTSIIQTVNGQFQVLAIAGDSWLGGDDFDREIVRHINEWANQRYGFDPSSDKRYLMEAKLVAERVKIALSRAEATDLTIPAAVRAPNCPPLDVDFELSRETFEQMIRPHVERSIDIVQGVLDSQNLGPEEFTQVLLVGGSTGIPLVQRAIAAKFGQDKVNSTIDPMHCVSVGAAHLAATLQAAQPAKAGSAPAPATGIGLSEVTARNIGIEAIGPDSRPDFFSVVIPAGTTYPLTNPMERTYRTTTMSNLRIPIYEGDDRIASRNELQGTLEYELPKDVPPGTPVIVVFDYNKHRLLTARVRIQGRGDLGPPTQLNRDQPLRTRGDDRWQETLTGTIGTAQHFLAAYRDYIDNGTRAKVTADIAKSQQALVDKNAANGAQLSKALTMALLGSGLASTLFLVERTQEWAPPQDAERLRTGARELRDAHRRGDQARVDQLNMALQALVLRLMEARGQAAGDFGGLVAEVQSVHSQNPGRKS